MTIVWTIHMNIVWTITHKYRVDDYTWISCGRLHINIVWSIIYGCRFDDYIWTSCWQWMWSVWILLFHSLFSVCYNYLNKLLNTRLLINLVYIWINILEQMAYDKILSKTLKQIINLRWVYKLLSTSPGSDSNSRKMKFLYIYMYVYKQSR